MKEIAIANQVARRRDAGMEEDESKGSTHWIFIIYNIYLYIMNDK